MATDMETRYALKILANMKNKQDNFNDMSYTDQYMTNSNRIDQKPIDSQIDFDPKMELLKNESGNYSSRSPQNSHFSDIEVSPEDVNKEVENMKIDQINKEDSSERFDYDTAMLGSPKSQIMLDQTKRKHKKKNRGSNAYMRARNIANKSADTIYEDLNKI